MKLRPVADILERSNAGGGSSLRFMAQPFNDEEARMIADRSRSYREEDENWKRAYGVQVPDDYRRFLRELATYIARKKSVYARSSEFFDEAFEHYPISVRVLQDWRTKGRDFGYISVAGCQDFGLAAANGQDTCIYFLHQQKLKLLATIG
ncbi:hypothetical protein EHI44_29535 [Rhizobium leguminosarum]|uniref:hypothetical protein n=1 Tax=Rhizobium leguminosarum TaxID=384 RepID=UPI000FF44B40|nr:hypothetical protein [Rhizobium leguminosarum]MDI5929066.1 hypothetical protein [Rhizobium leguminosarum]RWY80468.1 hypothetical protein EHI44_29535 [Rhizobium leguminosarum]